MSLPLEGIKVVSLTHYLQGPSCVQFLADLGADVVKVERLGGSYERHWSGADAYVGDHASVFFLLAGRNQRSIELDYRSSEGAGVLWRLLERADVLVENFRPGTLDKHGFSYAVVKARNPGIVYASLSGYGSDGPSRTRPGQDLLLQSLSGMATLSGRAGDPPVLFGTAIVDEHAAALGALAIVASLMGRSHSGKGTRVDSNLLSAALDLQLEPLSIHLNGSHLYERSASGISSRFHQAPYGVFKTADGWLTLSLADGPTLAKAFDDPGFAKWSKPDQFTCREDVNRRVAEHMRHKTTAQWEAQLESRGMWCARVRNYDEVLADSQLAINQSILEFDDEHTGHVKLVAHPVRYDGKVPPLRRKPPLAGQHTDEILHELGFSGAEVTALHANGVVGGGGRNGERAAGSKAP
ncbi:MAG TPA: CaiB/BaiF CoA-transferase family protein [Rhodanobacteraceae bacterium]|nr:CaiB/BaiF CoA-transferase family protein [Rhodanobacteraceae bacterium]